MKTLSIFVSSVLLMSISHTAMSADIEAGKTKAALCASCHGANGIAVMPSYPNLAGQNEAYLISALKAYKNKERNGGMAGIMQMQASNLSDEDIANIAAYYASLK